MAKGIKILGFFVVLATVVFGIYFGGTIKYAGNYNKIIKLLDEAFVFAQKGGGEMALQKANAAGLESKKFLETWFTKLIKDRDSRALLKARFNILHSQSLYEMGRYQDDDTLTKEALQIIESSAISSRSTLSEMESFEKEFIRKLNQYRAHYASLKAEGYAKKLISVIEKRGGALKKSLPSLHSVLGKIYMDQKKWAEAKVEYEKSLSMAEGILWAEEAFYAISYWRLGFIHLKQKQYHEAENRMRQSLEKMTRLKKPNNAILSEIYHNLAEIYQAERKVSLAGEFFDKSLEQHEKTFGEKDHRILHVLIDYAAYLKSVGSADKAKLLEDRAKAIEVESRRDIASPP